MTTLTTKLEKLTHQVLRFGIQYCFKAWLLLKIPTVEQRISAKIGFKLILEILWKVRKKCKGLIFCVLSILQITQTETWPCLSLLVMKTDIELLITNNV